MNLGLLAHSRLGRDTSCRRRMGGRHSRRSVRHNRCLRGAGPCCRASQRCQWWGARPKRCGGWARYRPSRGWLQTCRWRGERLRWRGDPTLESGQGRDPWQLGGAFSRRPHRHSGGPRGCALLDRGKRNEGVSLAARALARERPCWRAVTHHRRRTCVAPGGRGHRWRHRQRQVDLEEPLLPGHDLGEAFGSVTAAYRGSDQLAAPIADSGLLLAAPHLERAGQHVVLAVAHDLDEWALGQTPVGGARLRQRSGLGVRQTGIDHEAGTGHPLQGGGSFLATLVAGEGVVEAAGQEVHLACQRTPGAGCEHADAGRQGCS